MLGFLRGAGGELRAGYQLAAKLGPWTAARGAGQHFVVQAEATMVDKYWITRRPLMLRLYMQRGSMRWKWTGVEVSVNNENHLTVYTAGKRE